MLCRVAGSVRHTRANNGQARPRVAHATRSRGWVRCIHTNDSKRELGSRVDRHEHIGKGKIGKNGFAHFISDPRWQGVPFILETPKGRDGRGTELDKVNLKWLMIRTR